MYSFPTPGNHFADCIYIPNLSLAFEYQGEHHYRSSSIYGTPERQQEHDAEKHDACKSSGITLIPIPFWWNGKIGNRTHHGDITRKFGRFDP